MAAGNFLRDWRNATSSLRLALAMLHEMGIDPALITCNAGNMASARVIQKCGGVRFEDAITEAGLEWRFRVPTGVPSTC